MQDDSLIARGNTADIYLESGIVRKVYHRESRTAVETEALNQEFARTAGLPVPRVIGLNQSDGLISLHMEYLPGTTMLAAIEREPKRLAEFLGRSVELQIRVHATPAPDLRPMSDRLRQQISSVPNLPDNLKSALIEQLGDIGAESQLCHGDFHIQNILVHSDHLAIIDWMDATRGNPLLDACRSYLLYDGVNQSFAALYLSEYCRVSTSDPSDVTRWLPVVAAARLSEHVNPEEASRLSELIQIH